MINKQCSSCRLWKPVEGFSKKRAAKDGYQSKCKECSSTYFSEYFSSNARQITERATLWARQNPDGVKRRSANWDQKNRAYRNAAYKSYQTRKHNSCPSWADHSAIDQFYECADFLSMVTGEWHNVDHIVPIKSPFLQSLDGNTFSAREFIGPLLPVVVGFHVQANLQVLTRAANASKGNRWWPDMPVWSPNVRGL